MRHIALRPIELQGNANDVKGWVRSSAMPGLACGSVIAAMELAIRPKQILNETSIATLGLMQEFESQIPMTHRDVGIAELEARIAEQDRVIGDLNEMVVAQWKKIDALERRLGELRDEFDAASLARNEGREKPPPHY